MLPLFASLPPLLLLLPISLSTSLNMCIRLSRECPGGSSGMANTKPSGPCVGTLRYFSARWISAVWYPSLMALLRRRSFEAALATRLFFLGFRVDLTRDLDGDLSGEDEMKDTRSITFDS